MFNQIENSLAKLSISELATVVRADWKKVNFAAKPYLDAMECLTSVEDDFGFDNGKSIVIYFLCNATSWRGATAKAVKAELKRRAGIK